MARSLFGSASMAAGYATARPPVHPRIIERVAERLGMSEPVQRALDVGCGAGLSTRPLQRLARQCFGVEPVEAMLAWAPGKGFSVGRAEALPIQSASIDLMTAAGSLNYVDLDAFFPEAVRVLRPGGVLVVYDFSQGRSFRDSDLLDNWYLEFIRRYPPRHDDSRRELSPEILGARASAMKLIAGESFEIGLPMSANSYVDYAMTETNVAAAVNRGAPEPGIRSWCATTLAPVFGPSEKEVLFRGYFACLVGQISRPAPGVHARP